MKKIYHKEGVIMKVSYPWHPGQSDGTYCNPVIPADYSDPDVIRVGEDFYLTASSFNCVPGLPILHSRDLLSWTIIGHALREVPHERFSEVQHGQGVWAPAIRFREGKYYIFFPMPDEGIYVNSAENPRGSWSSPHLLLPGKGLIDPCPFWDDDGRAWLVHAYANSRAGIHSKLHLRPMAPDCSELLGAGRIVFDEPQRHPTLEGPKMHKWNGWYYLSAPAGGVATGWQLILRSREIFGPYEEKIVLAQRGTPVNGPHQGAFVDTPSGEWWFLHFQDCDAYGRIVHLQPVRWENDWPLIGVEQDSEGTGKPVMRYRQPDIENSKDLPPCSPQTADEFTNPELSLQWQWHANPGASWFSLSDRPGFLRLFPQLVVRSEFNKAGNLLLQKFPAFEFDIETELELNAAVGSIQAGLIVMGSEYAALDLHQSSEGMVARLLSTAHQPAPREHVPDGPIRLRVEVRSGGICRFGIIIDEKFHQLGPVITARKGGWIGAKIGLYCLTTNPLEKNGHADFSYFRFFPPQEN